MLQRQGNQINMPSIGDGPTNSYAAELGSHNAIYHPEGVNVTNLNPSHIFTSRQQSTVARWFGEIFAKKSDAFANTVHDRTASPYTGRFLIMTPRVDPKVFFANERTFLGMRDNYAIMISSVFHLSSSLTRIISLVACFSFSSRGQCGTHGIDRIRCRL